MSSRVLDPPRHPIKARHNQGRMAARPSNHRASVKAREAFVAITDS
jgi:hypothetical protein